MVNHIRYRLWNSPAHLWHECVECVWQPAVKANTENNQNLYECNHFGSYAYVCMCACTAVGARISAWENAILFKTLFRIQPWKIDIWTLATDWQSLKCIPFLHFRFRNLIRCVINHCILCFFICDMRHPEVVRSLAASTLACLWP